VVLVLGLRDTDTVSVVDSESLAEDVNDSVVDEEGVWLAVGDGEFDSDELSLREADCVTLADGDTLQDSDMLGEVDVLMDCVELMVIVPLADTEGDALLDALPELEEDNENENVVLRLAVMLAEVLLLCDALVEGVVLSEGDALSVRLLLVERLDESDIDWLALVDPVAEVLADLELLSLALWLSDAL
jgi:hypothetical protein